MVIAIGQGPNPLATKSTPGLELNRHGNIVVDRDGMMTSIGRFRRRRHRDGRGHRDPRDGRGQEAARR